MPVIAVARGTGSVGRSFVKEILTLLFTLTFTFIKPRLSKCLNNINNKNNPF